ncbi:hypothetical protein QFC22_001261 [Naganishia vaughanmartiniae]|uniref:Uncharacterized protein n=1 Tax=Naganishia vaughanmartiniae TaxID=1424756 RepID=A0ACC2XIG3_9TREE|nr:hypothetical protein QFC22_001261 [Naganishia vaughanmartiniae]
MVVPSAFQPESLKNAITSPVHHLHPSHDHSSAATTQPEAEPGQSEHTHHISNALHGHHGADTQAVIDERIINETPGEITPPSQPGGPVSKVISFFKNDNSADSKPSDSSTTADGIKSPDTASPGGGRYLIGFFKALASAHDSDTDDSDTEASESAPATARQHYASPLQPKEESDTTAGSTKSTGSQGQGEWVPAVRTAATTNQPSGPMSTQEKIVVPSFYRTPSVAQDDLSHRLAVLSVNNFSGLHGHDDRLRVGEAEIENHVKHVKERDPRAVVLDREPRSEVEAEHQEQIVEHLREEAHDEIVEHKRKVLERRETEIKEALVHDDEATLRSKLVPADLATRHDDDIIPAGMSAGEASDLRRASESDPSRAPRDRLQHDEATREQYATAVPEESEDTLRIPEEELREREKISAEEKLYAINEEFGDLTRLIEGDEREVFVAESRGALFRGIIIVGNIHLTSHRITFHAMLPPPKMSTNGDDQTAILHSGPVTIRRESHAKLTPKTRRLWMELGPDMITTYPGADEEGRVRPIRSVLLATIKQLYPMDPENPFELRLRYTVPKGEEMLIFMVDTEESALHWHRDLESALFQHGRLRRYEKRLADRARSMAERPNAPSLEGLPTFEEDDGGWEMMRICLPLDRVTEVGTEDYMDFARLISLDVDVMQVKGTGRRERRANREQRSMCEQFDMLYPINPGYKTLQIKSPTSEFPSPSRTSTFTVDSASTAVNDQATIASTTTATTGKVRKRDKLAEALGFKHLHKSHSRNTSSPGSEPGSPRVSMDAASPTSRSFATQSQPHPQESHQDVTRNDMPGGRATPLSGTATSGEVTTANNSSSEEIAQPGKKTGQGAFRGPVTDPKDLTSNASIIPADDETIPGPTHPESHTKVNIKFGILNDRESFAQLFHETIGNARKANRVYKAGVILPMPVFEVGQSNLLRIREVEGGAGLDPEDVSHPNPDGTPSGNGTIPNPVHTHVDGHETDVVDVEDTSDSDYEGDPGGVTESSKQRKVANAKVMFGIPPDDTVWMKRCYLNRTVPFRGHLILSDKYLCFWRKTVGPIGDIKYRFPVHDVKGAKKNQAFRFTLNGLSVEITGHHDLHFDFFSVKSRDETLDRIQRLVADHALMHSKLAPEEAVSTPSTEIDNELESSNKQENKRDAAIANSLDFAVDTPQAIRDREIERRQRTANVLGVINPESMELAIPDEAVSHLPSVVNAGDASRKIRPRRFALLTIGSRGDIQPYIALGLGLMKDGHQVVIVTHDEFKDWIEGYGIEHRQAGGDPAALMKLSVEHTMFSPGFFKESLGGFRTWLDDLLRDAWFACQDADVLIESPSAMAGIHIAEGLGIPYMRAFTMPWTRTSAYPQAFMVPAVPMGPGFNYSTYVLFDNIMWKATAGQVNKWRRKLLKLPNTDLGKLGQTKVPFMYNFSSYVVSKPLDWHDDIQITGYWTLANSDSDWSPPDDLEEFMNKAQEDGKALVYIGFGSITVPDPVKMTEEIVRAVDRADVRAIIAKGWSSRGGKGGDNNESSPEYSSNCYALDKVPHGWLFPRVKAVLHHGGAGTVGASLSWGKPTIIRPWFGDQYFWAGRVQKLGVGLRVDNLGGDDLVNALQMATTDTVMIEKAAKIGEKIRAEDGVKNAIEYIYGYLPRAAKDRTQLNWQGR